MRITLVSWHLPEPDGSAAGRMLWAAAEGLRAEGQDARTISWCDAPPEGSLPTYAEWRPLPPEPRWQTRARALLHPRWDAARLNLDAEGVGIAEEAVSYAAVAAFDRPVLAAHTAARIEMAATRRVSPWQVQQFRAERRAATNADLVLAYSGRVAKAVRAGTVVVPAAVPVPERPLPLVDDPVAALIADWRWAPNRMALRHLLGGWPQVRAAVPGARLLLAGNDNPGVGLLAGVEWLGPVRHSADVLARAAVLPFPCPRTSGPKVKVLEAMAVGLAVLTTPAGVEGVMSGGDAAAVCQSASFIPELIALLRDPGRRADLAAAGRAAILAHHAPRPAARARIAALGVRGASQRPDA